MTDSTDEFIAEQKEKLRKMREYQAAQMEGQLRAQTFAGPMHGSLEWWRWHIATELMSAAVVTPIDASMLRGKTVAQAVVEAADALIAELRKGGGK